MWYSTSLNAIIDNNSHSLCPLCVAWQVFDRQIIIGKAITNVWFVFISITLDVNDAKTSNACICVRSWFKWVQKVCDFNDFVVGNSEFDWTLEFYSSRIDLCACALVRILSLRLVTKKYHLFNSSHFTCMWYLMSDTSKSIF